MSTPLNPKKLQAMNRMMEEDPDMKLFSKNPGEFFRKMARESGMTDENEIEAYVSKNLNEIMMKQMEFSKIEERLNQLEALENDE
jgi:cytidylate kinase